MLANVIRNELDQIFCQFDSKLEAADEVWTQPAESMANCVAVVLAMIQKRMMTIFNSPTVLEKWQKTHAVSCVILGDCVLLEIEV